eukprot:TRINITY_DN110865_c0_g1_i1.p1 TRINITY_DN110865_c0_g1~~TRINITY_DN110865_c0_g1_i1.p1  ORF type:complete len:632 (-),score=164.48 TRINITY_DN110865_c0_g1_i1:83-1978(-)
MAPGVSLAADALWNQVPEASAAAAAGVAPSTASSFLDLQGINAATSKLSGAVSAKLHQLLSPEYASFQWAHDKLVGPSRANASQGRFVEYVAAHSPDMAQIDAVWWDALKTWLAQNGEECHQVVWQQKECVDSWGQPGKDASECMVQGVRSTPVIRFFPAGSPLGHDFQGELVPSQLVDFAKRWNKVDLEERAAVPPGQESHDHGVQLISYDMAPCPHCPNFRPAFEDAARHWQTDAAAAKAAAVEWQAKECVDKDLQPGKDYEECVAQGVKTYPTVRLLRPDPAAAEKQVAIDYEGPRTRDALLDFTKEATADLLQKAPQLPEEHGGASIQAEAELDHDTNVAKEGYDYKVVNYYSAAGPRSQRLGGIFVGAHDKWQQLTDPDEDAMFIASMKKRDKEVGGLHDWGEQRTDPPFVWFEQRECYGKDWQPGQDYALCQKHGVTQVPSIKLFSARPDAAGFREEGVEFHGPRTVKGIVKFLSDQTDLERIAEHADRQTEALIGTKGASEGVQVAPAKVVSPPEEPTFIDNVRQTLHLDELAAGFKKNLGALASGGGLKPGDSSGIPAANDPKSAAAVAAQLEAVGVGPPSAVLASLPAKAAAMPMAALMVAGSYAPPPPQRCHGRSRGAGFL